MQKKLKNNLTKLLGIIILIQTLGCGSKIEKEKAKVSKGLWRMAMDIGGQELPFNFTLNEKNGSWEMIIINAEERILVNEVAFKNDSFTITLPVFESEFKLAIINPDSLNGVWINYYKGADYQINTTGSFGKNNRFSGIQKDFFKTIEGKYEVVFSPDSKSPSKAIGLFKQNNTEITGTFVTETGDYRHLEGEFIEDTLVLSTFDGSHAFLFKAHFNDTIFQGKFWSGTHWEEPWVGKLNSEISLRNPDSLTFIKKGFSRIEFSFPNVEKKMVSLTDSKYENKVVIVQIMGSWCPNCLDETNYFTELYKKYNQSGLEIIALAFERTRAEGNAFKNIERLKQRTGAPYEILLGGSTQEDKAAKALPMLNHIMSYPTALFIDKEGEIRKIHTGFYGPGTGQYFVDYSKKTEAFIEALLNE